MRRRPGIQGIQRTQAAREQYKQLGDHVNQTKLELMRAQMATFKESLEKFALEYRKDIRTDPVFRAQFHAMCANIGVDPLASNKGTWNKLLGLGDFYYELGVQVVEACMLLRSVTGGLSELTQIHRYVSRRRGSKADPISEDDIVRAVDKVAALDSSFRVIKIGGRAFLRSVPTELSTDANTLIELAQRLGGYMTLADIAANTGWPEQRIRHELELMARDELVLIDDPPDGASRLYWVPAVSILPAVEQYRQFAGLTSVPLPPTEMYRFLEVSVPLGK